MDNGPEARLQPADNASQLDDLTQRGVLSKPAGATRPNAHETARARAHGSVSELVSDQRR